LSDAAQNLVRKLWQYCNVLRDDGLSYPDYVEQLTYLLFLKMADEQAGSLIPSEFAWPTLAVLDAEPMHRHYGAVLSALGQHGGMLGVIFRNAKNKIRDPFKLRLLVVDLIGQTEWTGLSADVKGDAYEGLLEKNARDTKSGAGQYFTPRPLIDAIVTCVDPRPGEVICDPACGTGGFLLAAYEYVRSANPEMTATMRRHLATRGIRGVELVEEVARLASMNALLHGIGGLADGELPIACADSLKTPPAQGVDVVLTNPPFGVKGSANSGRTKRAARSDDLTIARPDFWVQTANKQLAFLEHVFTLLKPGGRAAVVLPDNVLFETGAAEVIRRQLLTECDVHTLLRLPPGLFYAQGVLANVLFFDRPRDKPASAGRSVWVYDLRTGNGRYSLKKNPLRRGDLDDFVRCYNPSARADRAACLQSDRWQAFDVVDLLQSEGCRLDLSLLVDSAVGISDGHKHSSGLSRLDDISQQITADLQRALQHLAQAHPTRDA
jgi:type I restriction enzyme M protein